MAKHKTATSSRKNTARKKTATSPRKPAVASSPHRQATPSETPRALGFRMPAEWEPHAATWLAWPYSRDWPGKLQTVRWVFADLVRHLTQGERVRLLVKDKPAIPVVQAQLTRAGVDVSRVDFFVAATDRTWTRDNLPQFVIDKRRSTLGAVKFEFNGWARYDDHHLDERAGQAVAKAYGSPLWLPKRNAAPRAPRFVLEGGAIDVDGEGTLLTTRRCLLGSPFQRNPGLTEVEVEDTLKQYLNVECILWLEDGIAGDDTSGHIDDFARFVGPGKVVIAQEKYSGDKNHAPLKRAYEALSQARDAQGRRLELIPLPMPAPLYFDAERLPASYANFYIANGQVLVPTFNDPMDRVALGILSEVFPNRLVVGVHASDLVVGLGTLHCSTQQEPALSRQPDPS